jgi:hypothetical protein
MTQGIGWSEDEYRNCLECERILFAWCLVQLGGYQTDAAQRKSEERYPYEPADAPYRGLVFHNSAWTWAMEELHGHGFWWSQPELQTPSPEYDLEYDRVYASGPPG